MAERPTNGELVIVTTKPNGQYGNYDDGDILCAFSALSIRMRHASNLCHFRKAERNEDNLILPNSVCKNWHELTNKYRIERRGTRLVRIEISSGQEESFRRNVNARDIVAYRNLAGIRQGQLDGTMVPKPFMFGEFGSEFWYEGRLDLDHTIMDNVWDMIESRTENEEGDFHRWPAGVKELKSFLWVKTDDFDESTRASYIEQETEEDAEGDITVVTPRTKRVIWRPLYPGHVPDILDRGVSFDRRNLDVFSKAVIVSNKGNN